MKRSLIVAFLISLSWTILSLAPIAAGPLDMAQSAALVSVKGNQDVSAEQQLADRFVPIARLRAQKRACDRDGEGYFPVPVETVLGNPDVALK